MGTKTRLYGMGLLRVKLLQDRVFDKMLQEHGLDISRGQRGILFVLWQRDCLTISEISELTLLAKNTVSIVVNGMVEKGIVKREINPSNRRQTIISLTDYAKSMYSQYEEVSQQITDLVYTGFTEQEKDAFESYLQRITQTLIRYEAENKETRR